MMGVGSEARGDEQFSLSEVLKDRLYFAPLQSVEDTSAVVKCLPKRTISFNIDSELVRVPFSPLLSFPFLFSPRFKFGMPDM